MKKFIKKNIFEIYVFIAVITILSFKVAYEQRGYFTVGGEIFIPIIPIIIYFLTKEEK